MYNRILAPVDGSPTSSRGLEEAIKLAADQQAKLRIIHVVDEFMATMDFSGMASLSELLDILRESGERILADARAPATKHGIDVETVMRESVDGRVADVIVKEAQAWPADVVVMGTHGRRGISHLFLGSDAEAVVRTSPVPVLLVRSAPTEGSGTIS